MSQFELNVPALGSLSQQNLAIPPVFPIANGGLYRPPSPQGAGFDNGASRPGVASGMISFEGEALTQSISSFQFEGERGGSEGIEIVSLDFSAAPLSAAFRLQIWFGRPGAAPYVAINELLVDGNIRRDACSILVLPGYQMFVNVFDVAGAIVTGAHRLSLGFMKLNEVCDVICAMTRSRSVVPDPDGAECPYVTNMTPNAVVIRNSGNVVKTLQGTFLDNVTSVYFVGPNGQTIPTTLNLIDPGNLEITINSNTIPATGLGAYNLVVNGAGADLVNFGDPGVCAPFLLYQSLVVTAA